MTKLNGQQCHNNRLTKGNFYLFISNQKPKKGEPVGQKNFSTLDILTCRVAAKTLVYQIRLIMAPFLKNVPEGKFITEKDTENNHSNNTIEKA